MNTQLVRLLAFLAVVTAYAFPTASAHGGLVLDKPTILGLRDLKCQREPKFFDDLSPVGRKCLFGDIAKRVQQFVVEENGEWRWQLINDLKVCKGEKGKASDYDLLMELVSEVLMELVSEVQRKKSVVTRGQRQAYQAFHDLAVAHFREGGNMELRPEYSWSARIAFFEVPSKCDQEYGVRFVIRNSTDPPSLSSGRVQRRLKLDHDDANLRTSSRDYPLFRHDTPFFVPSRGSSSTRLIDR